MAYNKVVLMGRLCTDPELKYTPSNVAVTAFTIAVDRDHSKTGETDFIDAVAWRNTAEFICKYFNKGKEILVDGSIQTRNFEDKSGNKRKAVEVRVESAKFVGRKEDSTESKYARRPGNEASNNGYDDFVESDDDLPF